MSVERNIATIRQFYAAGPADDDTDRVPFFAPDVVWHVPGTNPVSGPYRGPEAIRTDLAARTAPLDEWTLDVLDVRGNADLVPGIVKVRGRRRGHMIETRGGHGLRFDDQGRVAEACGFTAQQDELDAFFRA